MPALYLVFVTVSVHVPEEMVLGPVASLLVLLAEVSLKEVELLVNSRVTAIFTSAALKISPLTNRKVLSFKSLAVAFTRRARAGFEVAVIDPFETVRVKLVLSKVQGSNVITSFTCGPAPGA